MLAAAMSAVTVTAVPEAVCASACSGCVRSAPPLPRAPPPASLCAPSLAVCAATATRSTSWRIRRSQVGGEGISRVGVTLHIGGHVCCTIGSVTYAYMSELYGNLCGCCTCTECVFTRLLTCTAACTGLPAPPDQARRRFKCCSGGCACPHFFFVVAEGAWVLRCRCKHRHTEHHCAQAPFKCKKPTCACNGFDR